LSSIQSRVTVGPAAARLTRGITCVGHIDRRIPRRETSVCVRLLILSSPVIRRVCHNQSPFAAVLRSWNAGQEAHSGGNAPQGCREGAVVLPAADCISAHTPDGFSPLRVFGGGWGEKNDNQTSHHLSVLY
jgi:hypothetical protein